MNLQDGVLDDVILARVDAIVQQLNCIGHRAEGLARAVDKKLPYGNSYRDRRGMLIAANLCAIEHRAAMGTIDIRSPKTEV